MKILLTGAAGYLGSNLANSFVENGHCLICIEKEGVDLVRLNNIKKNIFIVYSNDKELEKRVVEFKPEIAVHTACLYENEDYYAMAEANYLYPLRMLNICIKSGVLKWINTDTALPNLLNKYALLKHQFGQWGEYYAHHGKISFINLKLEHFYGENEPLKHFFPLIVEKLKNNEKLELTEGKQKRDFVYLPDLIRIYNSLLEYEVDGYLEIPVGTGELPSIRVVIEYLKQILNSNSELCFGAVEMRKEEPSSNCDISILRALGLTCEWSWKEGFKNIWGEK